MVSFQTSTDELKSGSLDSLTCLCWQDGVPNISARILANAGGYTDICDCLCSHNTCSGNEIFVVCDLTDLTA